MSGAESAPALPRALASVRFDARAGRYLLGVAAFAVAYYVVAQGGYALQFTGSITAIWPPVGLAVGVLYLGGLRWWPGAVIRLRRGRLRSRWRQVRRPSGLTSALLTTRRRT